MNPSLDHFNGINVLKTYIYIFADYLFRNTGVGKVKFLGRDWNFLKIFLDIILHVPLLNYWSKNEKKDTIDGWCWE